MGDEPPYVPCPTCGVPVHPDPFYQRVHDEFYAINPHIQHGPKDDVDPEDALDDRL